MSGLFGDDDDSAVEKLKRAGIASKRTILAAMPTKHAAETAKTIFAALPRDRYGGIDRPADIVDKRFPQKHQEMRTPAGIVDERFPKEGEIKGIKMDLGKWQELIDTIKKRGEHFRNKGRH